MGSATRASPLRSRTTIFFRATVTRPAPSHALKTRLTECSVVILYGEYTDYIDQIGPAALNAGVTSSEFTRWGLGMAQEIDKAAMTLWLKYRQHDGELTGGPFGGDVDAFRYISTGAIIYF